MMKASVVKGAPSVTLWDREAIRAQLAIIASGIPVFSLSNKNSNLVFILKVDEKGVPVLEQRVPGR